MTGIRIADRFVLERLAGRGGMGEVWRARDELSGQPVAVKLLRVDQAAPERFLREAEILAAIRHNHVVKHVAHGSLPDGRLYLAMEWLDGIDLGKRLERGRLEIDEAITLGARVADALAIAHDRGIVHRDLKPPNLFLVDGDPRDVRVLDFGIARVIEATRGLTKSGVLVGTPGYTSPEQARGDQLIDARSDVFALGCVLYECITGHRAFPGEHVVAVLAKLLLADPTPLGTLRPEVPAPLDDYVRVMLAKLRENRPANGRAVADALRRIGRDAGARISHLPPERLALTPTERRIVSVIVAGVANPASAATLASGESEAHRRVLETIARTHDVRLEALGDGTSLLVIEGGGEASDRAARAARIALAVRSAVTGVPVALATGWTEASSRHPIGEVIDDAVGLLARSAEDGRIAEVAVDSVTSSLLRDRFDLEERDGYSYLRAEAEILTTKPAAMPLVGRDRFLARLRDLAEECFEERFARVVIVSGEAGVGKSRILSKLLEDLRGRSPRPRVWRARGDAVRRSSPYAVLRSGLRSVWGTPAGAPTSDLRAILREALLGLLPRERALAYAPLLSELAGIASEADDSPEMRALRADPARFHDEAGAAFAEVAAAMTRDRPLVLVLEDLQFCDVPTARILEAAVRHDAEIPLLVLAAARPEAREMLSLVATDWDLAILRLRRLGKRHTAELVRRVLGDPDDKTVARLVRLSEGIPLQLEELLDAEQQSDTEPGDELPTSLAAVLTARLERLDPDARAVLRAASVFGESFSVEGVKHVLAGALAGPRVDVALEEIERNELVADVRSGREANERRFRQGLLRDAAYASLTADNRAIAHRLAAGFLRSKKLGEPVELATHLERAGAVVEAAEEWLRAARISLGAGDRDGSASAVARAFACAPSGPLLAKAHVLSAQVAWARGDVGVAAEDARRGSELAERGSADWAEAMALRLAADVSAGRNVDTVEMAALSKLPHEIFASEQVVGAVYRLAGVLGSAARPEDAGRVGDLLEEAIGDRSDPRLRARLASLRGHQALANGDPWAHLAYSREALEAYRSTGDRRAAAFKVVVVGGSLLAIGEVEAADATLAGIIPECDTERYPVLAVSARVQRAVARARLGANEEALALVRTALELLREQPDPYEELAARAAHAWISVRLGRFSDAAKEVEHALTGDPHTVAPLKPLLLAILSQAALKERRTRDAVTAGSSALDLVETTPRLRRLAAVVALAAADALTAAGRPDEAARAIERGRGHVLAVAARAPDDAARAKYLALEENVALLGK